MGLALSVENLDSLEEDRRGLYVKQDDHYVLNVEGLPVPEDIQG